MAIFRLALHTQILIGMLLGAACGLFFGEMTVAFGVLGEAFIMLLKMTILPYISFSLIHAVGSLSVKAAVRLFARALLFFVGLWAVTLAVIYVISFLFPEQNIPIYYSNMSTFSGSEESLLEVFIPANPIQAFANNTIPAVVLFSLLFGVALIQLKSKAPFLSNVKTVLEVLTTITHWVANLSPIGCFALIAVSVGTMPFGEMAKLHLYLVAYLLGVFFLCFVLFPLLVSGLTPLHAGKFLKELRPALLLSFTTGNVLVSLPYVIEGLEQLHLPHKKNKGEAGADNTIESMVPIAYNFPTVGNLFAILFILFLAHFYAIPLGVWQKTRLFVGAIPVLFGPATSILSGVSFLIDKMHLPTDGIGLLLETLPITRNLQALGTTTGIATISLLLAFSCSSGLQISLKKLARNLVLSMLILGTLVALGRQMGSTPSPKKEGFSALTLSNSVEARVYRVGDEKKPRKREARYESVLDRIQQTGILRVGYNTDNMPFAYRNTKGNLVGYDIAFAHELANGLDARLEFYPFEYADLESHLSNNRYDIAMSAISVTPERMRTMGFTTPYMEMERALVVRDHRREEFANSSIVKQRIDFTLCVVKGTSFAEEAPSIFPMATVVEIDDVDDFLTEGKGDALLWAREEGTTWSLIHPAYTVVIPHPSLGKEYYAFAVARESDTFLEWVNYWLQIKQRDGFAEEQHTYWILGKRPDSEPRWSIIRDLLHWVE